MGLVFTIMMPIGVFIIRFCKGKCRIWIHAAWQTFSWALLIAGLASGIRVGKILDRVCSLSLCRGNLWLIMSLASQQHSYHSWDNRRCVASLTAIYWATSSLPSLQNTQTGSLDASTCLVWSVSNLVGNNQRRPRIATCGEYYSRGNCVWSCWWALRCGRYNCDDIV